MVEELVCVTVVTAVVVAVDRSAMLVSMRQGLGWVSARVEIVDELYAHASGDDSDQVLYGISRLR